VRRALFLILVTLSVSCTYTRVLVHPARPGSRTTWQVGHDVELARVSTKGYAGQKPGFRAVHNADEWLYVWSDPRPDRPHPPPPPPNVDWNNQIVLVATSMTSNAKSIELTHAVRTENGALQVYVVEELPGEGCKFETPKEAPVDVAVVNGTYDEVVYWVDRDLAMSCGARPTARIDCRLMGQTGAATKLTAAPGQAINCDGLKSDPGSANTITDRNWYFSSTAPGSVSKIKLSDGAKSATFALDAYGTYAIRHEVNDDEGRGADVTATVDVPPPADAIIVQMGWSKITSGDDPATFPRVELLGAEVPTKLGTKVAGKTCTSTADSGSTPWCKMNTIAYVTHLRLDPVEKKSYRFGVRYADERFQGGPMICLRVFAKGKPPAETCDDNTRKANDVWDAGVMDLETGALVLDTGKK
jgi:hypothetical protein